MPEFISEQHQVRFRLPEPITVRQQLGYFSEAILADGNMAVERLWRGARAIITEWECSRFPLDLDLDSVTDPKITEAIVWVAVRVKGHMDALEQAPKV